MNSPFPFYRNSIKKGPLFSTIAYLLILSNLSCNNTDTSSAQTKNPYKDIQLYEEAEFQELYPEPLSKTLREIPSQGIATIIKEVAEGEFKVIHEEIINGVKNTYAEVTYLNGNKEKLTPEIIIPIINEEDYLAIKDIIPQYTFLDSTYTKISYFPHYNTKRHTLYYVLMGSAFGYFIGKELYMLQNPNVYENPALYTSNNGAPQIPKDNKRIFYNLRATATIIDKLDNTQASNSYGAIFNTKELYKEEIVDTSIFYYQYPHELSYSTSYYSYHYEQFIITNYYRNGSIKKYLSPKLKGANKDYMSDKVAYYQSPYIAKPAIILTPSGNGNEYNSSNVTIYQRNSHNTSNSYNSHTPQAAQNASDNNTSKFNKNTNVRTNYSSVSNGSTGYFSTHNTSSHSGGSSHSYSG